MVRAIKLMKEYLAKWYMKCITFLLSFLLLQPLLSQSAPVGLIENKGQISDQYGRPNQLVQMLYNDGGFHVQLNDKGFSYEVFEKIKFNESHVSEFKIRRVDIEFEGANRIVWRKEKPFSERYNFYNRVHVENVQAFHMATAIDVWPGVSIQFKVDSSNAIKYEIIAKNTDVLSQVRLRVRGADQFDVKSKQISFSLGEHLITDDFPRTYLDCDQSKDVKLKIIALSPDVIGFETTKKSKCKLIIDPIPNLKWATYYGAGGSEHGYGVAADNVGDPFFCGSTTSSSNIATSGLGVYQVNYSGSDDAYLVKFLKDVDPASRKVFGNGVPILAIREQTSHTM